MIHLIPPLLLVCARWKPGCWGSREDPEERSVLQLTPGINLRLMCQTEHLPSKKTSNAMCFSGPWWSPGRRLYWGTQGVQRQTGDRRCSGDLSRPLYLATGLVIATIHWA